MPKGSKNTEKHYIRWKGEGEDSVYILKVLLKNPELRFSDFIADHKDWRDRYKITTLSKNFGNNRKKLADFFDGTNRKCVYL